MTGRLGRATEWATKAAIVGGYLYFFPYFGHLRNPNENVRVYMVLSIVDHHTFALNQTISEEGYVDDRAINRSHVCSGRQRVEPCTYSSKAPGTSYLGVPVYLALRTAYAAFGTTPDLAAVTYFLRLFCVILPSLLFVWAFFQFLCRYLQGDFERWLIVGTFALGTMSYTYAHEFVGHQLAAILAFGSFVLVERAYRGGDRWATLAAGFAAGYAAITEYPAILIVPIVAAYAAARLRGRVPAPLAVFGAGLVVPATLGMLYHQVCFDSPLRTGYSMLANPAYARFHSVGVFGIATPTLSAASYSLLSPARGLFFFAPFLLIGLVGLVMLWRDGRRAECTLTTAVVSVCVVYQSAVNPDIGGWSIGPRYIVLITPFLTFGAAACLEHFRRRSFWYLYGAAIPLCMLSVAFTFLSTVVFHTFPPQFTNPFYEWILPLMRMGYFNYSLGTWIGLRGMWSALPGLLPVAVMMLSFCLGPAAVDRPQRLARAAAAALIASILLTALSHLQRFDSAEKDAEFSRLARLWEPQPVTGEALTAARRRADDLPTDPGAEADFAWLLARTGQWQLALDRYARAAGALNQSDPRRSDR